jgi:chorismate synthase
MKSEVTLTNHSGGIQGGISNGADIYFRVCFKPTATIAQKQSMLKNDGSVVDVEPEHGRHDPCVVSRAVPVVEAMATIVIADHLLRNKLSRI